MVVQLGRRSQIGFAEEDHDGYDVDEQGQDATPPTVNRFYEFRSEGLAHTVNRLESEAIRNSDFQPNWARGGEGMEGPVQFELAARGFGLFFKHALGSVTTETPDGATDARDHIFTPGPLDELALTCQIVRGTVPFTYTGCKITSFELSCDVDQFALFQVQMVGRRELTAIPAATPTHPDYPLFTFIHGSLEVDGAEVAVNSARVELDNGMDTERRKWGSPYRRNPQPNAFRNLTGSFNADFTDLDHYHRYKLAEPGEYFPLKMLFRAGEIEPGMHFECELTTHVRFDGDTPTVGGPEEIRQEMQFKGFPLVGEGDGSALTIRYRTDDVAA